MTPRRPRCLRTRASRRAGGGMAAALCASLTALLPLIALSGCTQPRLDDTPILRDQPPAYGEVVARYNTRIGQVRGLSAQATARVSFAEVGDDGQSRTRTEQVEATLLLGLPDRVSLALRKLSQGLFFFGTGGGRYWWIDLTGETHTAWVGQTSRFSEAQAELLGLPCSPLELVCLLAVVPLPATGGAAQWSADGRLLGLVAPVGGPGRMAGATQRLWVDPDTLEPRQVELFDAQGRAVAISALADSVWVSGVDGRGIGGEGRLPSQAWVVFPGRQAELRLDLRDVSGWAIVADTFNFDAVAARQAVQRTVDVDAAVRGKRPPSPAAPTARPAGPLPTTESVRSPSLPPTAHSPSSRRRAGSAWW
jgi:hypothetical protein